MRMKTIPKIAEIQTSAAPAPAPRRSPARGATAPHPSQNRAPARSGNPHARQCSVPAAAGEALSIAGDVSPACCGVCDSFGSLERSIVPRWYENTDRHRLGGHVTHLRKSRPFLDSDASEGRFEGPIGIETQSQLAILHVEA